MPLEQPKRDNPLMRGYFRKIDLPGKLLARRFGRKYGVDLRPFWESP